MRHLTCCSLAVVVVLAGCRDNTQPTTPALEAAISDGAHAGNAHFFFLPPLVSSPATSGQFNARLSPVAEVCPLLGSPLSGPVDCADLDGNGKPDLVFGPARMSLDATNQQYQVNWDTKLSALDPTAFYRIIVRGSAQGTALGFIDIDPVAGGVKNAKTGDVFMFQDGRTLPIKVRIENGAFGGGTTSNDFVEQVVPNVIAGGTLDVTTNTQFAGARFTNGWLNPDLGIDQVVVIIERGGANCLTTGLEQLEGCYRFRTDPDLHLIRGGLPFIQNVIAGVCFQIPGDVHGEGGPPFELTRQEEVEGRASGPLTRLTEVDAPFLNCGSFGPTPPAIGAAFRSGRLGDIARAGWHAVSRTIARVIQPATLHAVDLGAGGSTDGFSFFGYARFASMSVTAGQGATAPAGSTIPAAVSVLNSHHGATSPVVRQSVTFTASGGGTVSAAGCAAGSVCSVPTGSNGVAAVSWQLGLGTNTLQVTTTQVTNSPQTITATGTPSPLSAYEVATSNAINLPALTGFARDVANCPAGKVVLGGGTQVVGAGTADFNTRMQESAPGTVGLNNETSLWLVSIDNEDAAAHNVQIFAACATAPFRYQVVTTDAAVPAGGFARTSANCPTGTVVLGGGAQVAGEGVGDFNTRIQESAPGTVGGGTNLWLASVRNQDGVPHTVRIFAVCASPPVGYEVVNGAVTSLGAGGGFNRDAVPCPAGKVVVGGGAQVVGEGSLNFNTRLQESTPGLTGPNNATNVWLVSMKNLDGVAHNVQFFAVCANAT